MPVRHTLNKMRSRVEPNELTLDNMEADHLGCARTPNRSFLLVHSGTCSLTHAHAHTQTHARSVCDLVEAGKVVSGLDEEGLVDPRVIHVVGGGCHQAEEHVQRAQLLRQLRQGSGVRAYAEHREPTVWLGMHRQTLSLQVT